MHLLGARHVLWAWLLWFCTYCEWKNGDFGYISSLIGQNKSDQKIWRLVLHKSSIICYHILFRNWTKVQINYCNYSWGMWLLNYFSSLINLTVGDMSAARSQAKPHSCRWIRNVWCYILLSKEVKVSNNIIRRESNWYHFDVLTNSNGLMVSFHQLTSSFHMLAHSYYFARYSSWSNQARMKYKRVVQYFNSELKRLTRLWLSCKYNWAMPRPNTGYGGWPLAG